MSGKSELEKLEAERLMFVELTQSTFSMHRRFIHAYLLQFVFGEILPISLYSST